MTGRLAYLTFAAAVLLSAQSSNAALQNCPDPRKNTQYVITIEIRDDGHLAWNGSAISRTTFEGYLSAAARDEPHALFLAYWAYAKASIVKDVLDRITAKGFAVAAHCQGGDF
ncbi:MAG: hypothetical protein ISS15_01790 [Alphaproteobacteria bacterium]|nr:hypothetical protein [Alphaproteobacteria bacterium]MBL6937074.1 hypothetical protein [Alphaproteobacteria bacterium]MBL7096364.1 hypothetical protein [Alphaproteobacteria bacterium]